MADNKCFSNITRDVLCESYSSLLSIVPSTSMNDLD